LKAVVIGVGNPFLGDDGVGIHVARIVRKGLPDGANVDVKEASASGIGLLEEMIGYEYAAIVDAIATGSPVGEIFRLNPDNLSNTAHLTAPHHFNFATVYELGKTFTPADMPKRVKIYGIEILPRTSYSESLSPKVIRAARLLAIEIIEDLMRPSSRQRP